MSEFIEACEQVTGAFSSDVLAGSSGSAIERVSDRLRLQEAETVAPCAERFVDYEVEPPSHGKAVGQATGLTMIPPLAKLVGGKKIGRLESAGIGELREAIDTSLAWGYLALASLDEVSWRGETVEPRVDLDPAELWQLWLPYLSSGLDGFRTPGGATDRTYMRPVVAVLAGAGLRVGEAIALDWRDVNLATGTLTVGSAKTDAGAGREVDLPGGLIEALSEWRAYRRSCGPGDPVLVTRTKRRQTVTNVDHRLKGTIRAANELLAGCGIDPISERVTPDSLRRTYASTRAAAGDHPVCIATQLGHEDPGFTFRVYQKAAKRRDRLGGAYLDAYDRAIDWAAMGSGADSEADSTRLNDGRQRQKTRHLQR